jgi:RNA polymerase sigma-70 factor (sigma-E family)
VSPDRRDEECRDYVLRRRPELVRTATLLACGDGHLGEDLVQIALTKLYVAWPRVRAETRDAYLHRTLVHATIDNGRRARRRPESPTDTLPDRPAPEAVDELPGGPIRDALAALPVRMRAAVVLVHWMDLDVDTAASALGCRAGTVKSQVSRGLAKLRVLLDPHSAQTQSPQTPAPYGPQPRATTGGTR